MTQTTPEPADDTFALSLGTRRLLFVFLVVNIVLQLIWFGGMVRSGVTASMLLYSIDRFVLLGLLLFTVGATMTRWRYLFACALIALGDVGYQFLSSLSSTVYRVADRAPGDPLFADSFFGIAALSVIVNAFLIAALVIRIPRDLLRSGTQSSTTDPDRS